MKSKGILVSLEINGFESRFNIHILDNIYPHRIFDSMTHEQTLIKLCLTMRTPGSAKERGFGFLVLFGNHHFSVVLLRNSIDEHSSSLVVEFDQPFVMVCH